MAGVYLHIPFCRQACHYCDFHFSTVMKDKVQLLDAMHREIDLQRDYLGGEEIETIYFGGGTPSLLSGSELATFLDSLQRHAAVASQAEITLEANPDDLTAEKLRELRSVGINRLSIGIQSFRDQDLVWMNRSHKASQSEYAVKCAQDVGFENITIDLIYSIPGLSADDWKRNLSAAIDLDVRHISAYSLTIEPKTVFGHEERKGRLRQVNQELSSVQFHDMVQAMTMAGFEHYEVSNFCQPGWESRHNTSYWQGKKYLGLGPSAHSFDGRSRQWNVSNNSVYTRSLLSGVLNFEREELDERTRLNEYIMTGLRTKWGIDLSKIRAQFGIEMLVVFAEQIEELIANGSMKHTDQNLVLTTSGFLLADRIASDFFILEQKI